MKFYRYTNDPYIDGTRISLEEYVLVKETPKGYWIAPEWYLDNKRWVSATAVRRFAYPTREEALVSFRARKTRQAKILQSQLDDTKAARDKALTMKSDDEYRGPILCHTKYQFRLR